MITLDLRVRDDIRDVHDSIPRERVCTGVVSYEDKTIVVRLSYREILILSDNEIESKKHGMFHAFITEALAGTPLEDKGIIKMLLIKYFVDNLQNVLKEIRDEL